MFRPLKTCSSLQRITVVVLLLMSAYIFLLLVSLSTELTSGVSWLKEENTKIMVEFSTQELSHQNLVIVDNNTIEFDQLPEDLMDRFFADTRRKHTRYDVDIDIDIDIDIDTRTHPRVPFGNTSTFECDSEHCHINGRIIRKELVIENPEDMFTFIPPEGGFLKEFRNPCWMGPDPNAAGKTIYCLPYFYIIGFTKCGTTDLFAILQEHPLVSARSSKEPHYFDRRRRARPRGMNQPPVSPYHSESLRYFAKGGLYKFAKHFRHTYKKIPNSDTLFHGITMDATPACVWDNEFWEVFHPGYREPPVTNADVIHTLTPKAKIIVSLRDPIKRMQSAYQFFCAHSIAECDKPSTNLKFHSLVTEAVEMFNECMLTNTVRGCVYSTRTHQLQTHLYASIYSVYLRDWLATFHKNHLYVLKFEDHIQDEAESFENIFEFLGIPSLPKEYMDTLLTTHEVRNKLQPRYKITLLPETVELLKRFFRPFNRDLVELLGDEKWMWGYDKHVT